MKFRTSTTGAATHEERLAGTHATASAALTVFQQAHDDLLGAARDADAVRAEIEDEIARLKVLADHADDAAFEHSSAAGKIRATGLASLPTA